MAAELSTFKKYYIPEDQFPATLAPDIYMLGNYFFNLFLVKGNRQSALFETGVSGIVDVVINQLEHLNIIPDFIIPSHPHSDHITGLPGLIEKYPAARIITASGAEKFIKHPRAALLMFKEDRFISKRLNDLQITPGRSPLEILPDLGGAETIDDKQSIDLGGITLDLIKINGHSPGNLIGILHEKKIVFCSDSLGFHFPGRGYIPLFFTRATSYLDTLYFIKDLVPCIICPAHQGPLTGKAAFDGINQSIKTTIDMIENIKHSSFDDEILSRDLFKHNYKDEFTLYTENNIKNCMSLIVKRAKEALYPFNY